MKDLEPPDTHYLSAAIGWLELGNPQEAKLELEQISPSLGSHPDVLEVSYDVLAANKQWEAGIAAARALGEVAPERACAWVHLAYALHEMKRTQEAYDVLVAVADRFSRDWLMRYNLACYQCQLGNLEEAWSWLQKAVKLNNRQQIKAMACEDRDLAPLWTKIRNAWSDN